MTKQIMEKDELRKVIAEEVNARSNIYQAKALIETVKWSKISSIGTFFMAFTTLILAFVTFLK